MFIPRSVLVGVGDSSTSKFTLQANEDGDSAASGWSLGINRIRHATEYCVPRNGHIDIGNGFCQGRIRNMDLNPVLSGYMSNKDNCLWLGPSEFCAFSSANA